MLRTIFHILFFLCPATIVLGQNLVPNASFEENTGCPGPDVFLNNTKDWFRVNNHSGTPDLFWKDCSYNGIGERNSMAHNQLPKDGQAFIGMFSCGDNLREYCYTELTETMKAGEKYAVSFWVRPASGYGTAINSFGAHFSKEPLQGNNSLAYLPLTEHLGLPSDKLLRDTTLWTLVQGTYIAQGGEKFLTLGNFRSDQTTQKEVIQTNCIRSDRSYILLDLVSVTKEDNELQPPILSKTEIQRVTKDVFYAKSNQIELQIWDNNRVDGDSVNLLLNDVIIDDQIAINKQLKTYNISLTEKVNYIELQAINIGLIPPNTVALRISDGHTEKKIILSSSLTLSETVKIVLEL